MLKKALAVAFLLAGSALLSVPAYAFEFYFGASYINTNADFSTAVDNFSTSDAGWKAFAGMDFVKWFGVEASYRDLGTQQDESGANSISADLTVWDLAVRGILPIGSVFQIFAKAGYASIGADVTAKEALQTITASDTERKLFYGAGVQFNLGKHFGIRGEWEEYDTDENLNSLSGGVAIRF